MRIVISLKKLHAGSATRGIGVYTRELIAALTKGYPKDKIIPTTHDPENVQGDIVHYPYFDPFYLSLKHPPKIPLVLTIHDLIPLRFPNHFPAGIKGKLKWLWQRRAARRANHIITDSESSKQDILQLIDVPESRVTVVPLGPNASARVSVQFTKKIAQNYNLPSKYLLYVGDINWNKNVVGLIETFAKLQEHDLWLVLVGKVFTDRPNITEHHAITKAIENSGKADRIIQLGYVPAHHLSVIYAAATLYVQPSWYEGFGLPILEAMKFGCPVASSNRGSLPEVGGNAVTYFDPEKNMSEVITELLTSPTKREELAKLGIIRAKEFTWDKTAKATHLVYEQVLSATT